MAQRTITYLILNALDISLYDIITNDMYLGIPNIAFLFVDILKIIPQTNQKKNEYAMKIIFTTIQQKIIVVDYIKTTLNTNSNKSFSYYGLKFYNAENLSEI